MPQYETDKGSLIGNTTCVTIGDNDNADNADDVEDYQNTVRQKGFRLHYQNTVRQKGCMLSITPEKTFAGRSALAKYF